LERRLNLDSKAVTMTQESSVADPDNFGPDLDLAYGTKPNPHPTPEIKGSRSCSMEEFCANLLYQEMVAKNWPIRLIFELKR
jgi:hypothetical protein